MVLLNKKDAIAFSQRSGYFLKLASLLLLLCIGVGLVPANVSGQQGDVCKIFAQKDATRVLGVEVDSGISRESMMPAGNSCRYSYRQDGSTYGVTVRISTDADIKNEGINDSAADLMQRQKKTRMNHAHAAKSYREIAGLGDEAFWDGTSLWCLHGDTLVLVKSSSYLQGSFTSKDEAKKAGEAQDLRLSQEITSLIVSRLQ